MEEEGRSAYGNSALFSANGLLYKMPQPLSTCVNRTFKKQYSQRQSYSQTDTIVFDVNSGSSYVDPASCMLTFGIELAFATNGVDGDNRVSFGSGSACNLIQEIRILSKNGCEVDRTQSAGVLAKIQKDYMYNVDGQKMLSNAGAGVSMEGGERYKFAIPLSFLSGFFRPVVKGMKIPSGLASGLRIELITARPARALQITAGTGTGVSYSIHNPEMLFSSSDLNDPTQAVLLKESAETGLEYTFPSYFSTNLTTAQTQITEQVKKAVSQCCRVFTSVYDVSGAGSVLDESNDGFKSVNSDQMKTYQYRVGANYYPQAHVDSQSEALYVTQACFDKTRDIRTNPCSVSITEYDSGGKFLVGHGLETDDRLNLSGIPLNNSSTLELRMEVDNVAGLSRQYEIVIEFIAVAKTHINKTSLKI